MNTMISTAGIPILVLCAVPVFVILFVTIARTLRHIPLFAGSHTVAMALCVTLLCMIGLYRTFVQPAGAEAATANDAERSLDFLLRPYTAMALAMLCVLLLLFVQRLLGCRGPAHLPADLAKRGKSAEVSRQSPGREGVNSVFSTLSKSPAKGLRSPFENSNCLKKIKTHQQKKEISK